MRVSVQGGPRRTADAYRHGFRIVRFSRLVGARSCHCAPARLALATRWILPKDCVRVPLREDPFSKKLNYYAGTTISNTRFFGLPFAPTGSVYSERRSEPLAYLRETSIGALFELSSTKWRRTVITPGLQYERGRTISDPLISCTRFNLCDATDENAQLFGRGVGVASLTGTHDRTNDPTNPSYGSRLRGDLRAGLTSDSASDPIYFYRSTVEAAGYTPFFGGVIAARVQLARVFAPGRARRERCAAHTTAGTVVCGWAKLRTRLQSEFARPTGVRIYHGQQDSR